MRCVEQDLNGSYCPMLSSIHCYSSLWELCLEMKNSIDLTQKFRNPALQMLSCWLEIHTDSHLLYILKWGIFAEHWENKRLKCLNQNSVFFILYLTISGSVVFFLCSLASYCVKHKWSHWYLLVHIKKKTSL